MKPRTCRHGWTDPQDGSASYCAACAEEYMSRPNRTDEGPVDYIVGTFANREIARYIADAINFAGCFNVGLTGDSDKTVMAHGQCVAETDDYFRGFLDAVNYCVQKKPPALPT